MRPASSRSATCRRIRITLSVDGAGIHRRSTRDVDVRSGVPITFDIDARTGRRDEHGRRRRSRRGSARTRPDRAHRHRSEPDRQAAARVLVRAEPGDHAGVAGRGVGFERVLPSDRRPRPDAVLDRQPAGHRSAEPRLLESDFAGRGAVDGNHHRRRARRIRRQEQPRSSTSSPSPASTSRSRPAARRSATDRSRARRPSSTSAAARTPSATSCRSAACARIASSIRRSSPRCTTRATPVVLQSTRRARWRHQHVPPQRAGGAVGVRRAEHVRSARCRPGAAPADQHRSTSRPATRRCSARRRCSPPTAFVRQDHLTYSPSADPFADQPGDGVAGSQADQHRRQGGRVVHERRTTT